MLSYFEAVLYIPGLYDEFANNLEYALPILFYYDHQDLPVKEAITMKIKEFYFNDGTKEKNITNVILNSMLMKRKCWP